jgi:hypothetical protein
MLEAPARMSNRFERAAEHWARTGGQPPAATDGEAEAPIDSENARWLDRAAGAVESRLNQLGTSYLRTLVRSFEQRGRQSEADRAESPAEPAPPP